MVVFQSMIQRIPSISPISSTSSLFFDSLSVIQLSKAKAMDPNRAQGLTAGGTLQEHSSVSCEISTVHSIAVFVQRHVATSTRNLTRPRFSLHDVYGPNVQLLQTWLNLRPASNGYHDCRIRTQLLPRHSKRVYPCNRVNLRWQVAIVFRGQPVHELLPNGRCRSFCRLKKPDQRFGKRIFRFL